MEGRIRVLTAFGNQLLQEYLIHKMPDIEFVSGDLQYQGALIEVLKDNRDNADAIILNAGLEGPHDFRELIQMIKNIRKGHKIVPLFKSGPDEDMQEWLMSKGIHYALVDNSFTVEDVYQSLTTPKKLMIMDSAKTACLNDNSITCKDKTDTHPSKNHFGFTDEIEENAVDNGNSPDTPVSKKGIMQRLIGTFAQTKPVSKALSNSIRIKNTLTIALFGSHHGSGCTHTALSMAWFLTNQMNEKAAIIEMNDSGTFRQLASCMEHSNEKHFEFNGLDLFYDTTVSSLISHKKYSYILIDCGCICKRDESGNICTINMENKSFAGLLSELERADLKICVCQMKPWQMNETVFLLDRMAENNIISGCSYYFTMTGEQSFLDIKRKFKSRNLFHAPYDPEIFCDNAVRDIVFNEMLAGILQL